MKLFQKTWVAVTITALMIAAAIGIGRAKPEQPVVKPTTDLDTTLSTGAYEKWIWDEAEVLSNATEEQLCLFNANWVNRYDSLIAVAMVDSVSGAIDDYAYDLFNDWGIGDAAENNGFLLLLAIEDDDYYARTGSGLDRKFSASTIKSYYDQGWYGKKAGRGFYEYESK